jgi:hypothetical protein
MKGVGLTIGLAIVAVVAFVGLNSTLFAMSPQTSSDGSVTESHSSSNSTIVRRRGRVVLDLVEPSGEVIVYDSFARNPAGRKGKFP